MILTISICVIIFSINAIPKNELINLNINGKTKIEKIINSGYIIKWKGQNILLKTNNNLELNDSFFIEGILSKPKNFNDFNYPLYLKTLNINWILNGPKITNIQKNYSIHNHIFNYFSNGPKLFVEYSNLLLLGKKNFVNIDNFINIKYLSILHLFVISGLHINFISYFLIQFSKKIKIPKKMAEIIPFPFLLFYIFILTFPISSLRAFIYLVLKYINKKYLNNKFKNIEILFFTLWWFFIFNFYIIFNYSIIYSFTISFFILWINNFTNHNKTLRIIMVYLGAQLASLGISIYLNNWINFMILINIIVLGPFVIVFYFLTILLFPFKEFLNSMYLILDYLINIFTALNIIKKFQQVNIMFIYTYYIMLIICIYFMEKKLSISKKASKKLLKKQRVKM